MNTKTLISAAVMAVLMAAPASAVPVHFNNVEYNVTTIEGSFLDNMDTLIDQPWWGDADDAYSFSVAVASSLDLDPHGTGPFFAYTAALNIPGNDTVSSFRYFSSSPGTSESFTGWVGRSLTFAVASIVPAVPLPAGGLMLLTGMAGLIGLRSRRRRAV